MLYHTPDLQISSDLRFVGVTVAGRSIIQMYSFAYSIFITITATSRVVVVYALLSLDKDETRASEKN